jgi:hypothetical protein
VTQGEFQGWLQALGAIVAAVCIAYNTLQGRRTAQATKKISADMRSLEINTNSKMDAALDALKAKGAADAALADMTGERRGREQAKEQT